MATCASHSCDKSWLDLSSFGMSCESLGPSRSSDGISYQNAPASGLSYPFKNWGLLFLDATLVFKEQTSHHVLRVTMLKSIMRRVNHS